VSVHSPSVVALIGLLGILIASGTTCLHHGGQCADSAAQLLCHLTCCADMLLQLTRNHASVAACRICNSLQP
jgi:xanthosine utilization system XapX-like protein